MTVTTQPITRLARALGIGRPVDPKPPRRPHLRYLLGETVYLTPWGETFRFGWALVVRGPYWERAYAVIGPDWRGCKLEGHREFGDFLGGQSWHRYGPIAVAGHRIRGSWRGDRISARMDREFRAKYGE